MKKIFYFAAVLAIAFVVATQFGLNLLFFGIAICFIGELVVFNAGGILESAETYETRLENSRKMLLCHIGWYVCTLLLAALFDVLGGYTYYVEEAVGNSFKYIPVYQEGDTWYLLFVAIVIRGVMQLFLEKRIKENIERAKNLPA
jgi:hypothetical protein